MYTNKKVFTSTQLLIFNKRGTNIFSKSFENSLAWCRSKSLSVRIGSGASKNVYGQFVSVFDVDTSSPLWDDCKSSSGPSVSPEPFDAISCSWCSKSLSEPADDVSNPFCLNSATASLKEMIFNYDHYYVSELLTS